MVSDGDQDESPGVPLDPLIAQSECSFLLQTEIIRKRLHKDIPHHSVIMLNFCPDLQSVQPCLRKAHGEFIFLIDRSSSMSGISMHRVKVPAERTPPQGPGLQGKSAVRPQPSFLSTFCSKKQLLKIGLNGDTQTPFASPKKREVV